MNGLLGGWFWGISFRRRNARSCSIRKSSDGKVGLANASGTRDEATVVGFAQTAKTAGQEVRCLVVGVLATSGLDVGEPYYLATSDGAITKNPPTTNGHFVVRVGEAATTANLTIQLEPPILLS